jgi:hypothetical protein
VNQLEEFHIRSTSRVNLKLPSAPSIQNHLYYPSAGSLASDRSDLLAEIFEL